jgi:hypothetical protein
VKQKPAAISEQLKLEQFASLQKRKLSFTMQMFGHKKHIKGLLKVDKAHSVLLTILMRG